MARFAANLTYLFTELPILQRFGAAKRAGFDGVEMLFPYDISVPELAAAAQAEGLVFVLMNGPPPNWSGGPRGFAAEPGNAKRFRTDFDRAIRFAQALRAQHVHIMAGNGHGPEARKTLVENLKWAARRAPKASLTIEPANPHDYPGYFLNDFDMAAEIIAEVGAPNLGLQFDAYQAHMIHGDVFALWQRMAPITRHVQIAGSPGRHEPRAGDIDFSAFFRVLQQSGYAGWIGAEYIPLTSTEAGLRWLRSA